MLEKIVFIGFLLTLNISLFGCKNTTNILENVKTAEKEDVNTISEPSSQDGDDKESDVDIHSSSTESVMRVIEGMSEEIHVVHYKITPYNISYQLDESFGSPEWKDNQIIYSTQNDTYQIIFEVLVHTDLEKAVTILQEEFGMDEYEEKSELENTLTEENNLKGLMQSFAYPIKGFYLYEIDNHVLAITYQYPAEGGDGMMPLLEDLRKSIHLN